MAQAARSISMMQEEVIVPCCGTQQKVQFIGGIREQEQTYTCPNCGAESKIVTVRGKGMAYFLYRHHFSRLDGTAMGQAKETNTPYEGVGPSVEWKRSQSQEEAIASYKALLAEQGK